MTNKELILKFYDEVFNNYDISNLDKYMHDDYIQHNPTVEDGKEGFKKFCNMFLSLKPKMEIKHIICEGDMVSVFFKCTMGANGMENKVADIYRIEDGMLVEHWDIIEHDIDETKSVNKNGLF